MGLAGYVWQAPGTALRVLPRFFDATRCRPLLPGVGRVPELDRGLGGRERPIRVPARERLADLAYGELAGSDGQRHTGIVGQLGQYLGDLHQNSSPTNVGA